MASNKRAAAGDEAAPPPTRLRVTAAAPGGSNLESSPPSPRKRLVKAMLVVFFTKLPVRGRTTESARIGRLGLELWQLRHDLVQVRDTFLHEFGELRHDLGQVHTLLRKQDSINKLILSKLDNMKGPFPNHNNHEHLIRQGTNQEGTNAETETEGKDSRVRLCFLSKMESTVFHDDEIKSIRIGIFDGEKIIESGPLSKLNIEVLALDGKFPYHAKGSWTSKEFQDHIASGRDGKRHVLEGKGTYAQLINGECHLGSIRFREGSCRTGSRSFIVAARVCDGQAICGRVQEAVMDPVRVLDRRTKYIQKGKHLRLEDGVQCLKYISSKYGKRLENQNIRTVEQFLKALNKDENSLCSILDLKPEHKRWLDMVDHAKTCCLEDKPDLKSYRCEEKNVELFFNYVHRLVGAKFGGHYIAYDNFNRDQKKLVETLKKNAYDQLDGLTGDYEMRDNIPVRTGMNMEGAAGPSCMANSAPQQINSGHHITEHQVEGTSASELLRPCAPHDPNSVPDPNSAYNCQVSGAMVLQNVLSVRGLPTVQGLIHGTNESSFAIVSDGPSTSSSVPYQLTTQSNQDQGTGFAAQQQHLGVVDGMLLGIQAFPQNQANNNNCEGAQGLRQGEMPHYPAIWSSDDDILEQFLNNTGNASLPNDVTMGSPVSASWEWFERQGNMPGNTPF